MRIESWICNRLLQDNIIQEEEKEVIKYGLHQGIALFVNICTLFIICSIIGCVTQGLWFLAYFWPLRIYAGGYHADTEKRCYLLSTLSEISIFITAIFCDLQREKEIIVVEVALVTLICLMSPQDTENRRLSSEEKAVYKKKTNRILVFHIISFIIMYLINKKEVWEIIFLSQILMVVILMMGYIKGRLKGKMKRDATTKEC